MRLTVNSNSGTWRLTDLEPIHVQLLRQAAEDASIADCPSGRSRLFPSPVTEADAIREASLIDDWKELVTEELDTQFASEVGTFLDDFDSVQSYVLSDEGKEERHRLDIPLTHGGAWFSTLNQARLMLDEKYELHPDGEEFHPDLLPDSLGEISGPERLAAYMRYEFYALVQEWIVQHVLSGGES